MPFNICPNLTIPRVLGSAFAYAGNALYSLAAKVRRFFSEGNPYARVVESRSACKPCNPEPKVEPPVVPDAESLSESDQPQSSCYRIFARLFCCCRRTRSKPVVVNCHTPAVDQANKPQAERNLRTLLKNSGLPEEIHETFVTNLIPPGELESCVVNPDKTFVIRLRSKERIGKLENVGKDGFDKLNNRQIVITQHIEGRYDPSTCTIIFEKGLNINIKWGVKVALQGFSLFDGINPDDGVTPQKRLKILTSLMETSGRVSKFNPTFAKLVWS